MYFIFILLRWTLFTDDATADSSHAQVSTTTTGGGKHRSKPSSQSSTNFTDGPLLFPHSHAPLLSPVVFHSSKLNSKVTRQLSDFLSVATQRIPEWAVALVRAIPFVFPFSTRRSLLYCTAFGRDRALMHLCSENGGEEHENGGAGTSSDSASRLINRLERRKVTINRGSLLKDAHNIFMNSLGSFRYPLI
jgi:hypothetical protein